MIYFGIWKPKTYFSSNFVLWFIIMVTILTGTYIFYIHHLLLCLIICSRSYGIHLNIQYNVAWKFHTMLQGCIRVALAPGAPLAVRLRPVYCDSYRCSTRVSHRKFSPDIWCTGRRLSYDETWVLVLGRAHVVRSSLICIVKKIISYEPNAISFPIETEIHATLFSLTFIWYSYRMNQTTQKLVVPSNGGAYNSFPSSMNCFEFAQTCPSVWTPNIWLSVVGSGNGDMNVLFPFEASVLKKISHNFM